MDAVHQTVAQAAAAATQQAAQQQQQQQQPQQHASSPQVQLPHQHQTSTIDNLTCQWQGCGERTDSAESLYDHVCERHVGRKSTNNLNLTCQWGSCRTTTVKRDHITSHIRVHVPLKPHKCDFCGKSFKRPQDLKKHVKTHADDSVLMNSPSHAHAQRATSHGQSAPSGYYPSSHDAPMNNHYASYQPSLANGASGSPFAQAANGQYAGYGSVSYPNSSAMADIQSMDTRRRAIEALNDFLGDIKRRQINPNTYYDVGHRLQGTSLPLPVNTTGYNTGYSNTGYSSNFNAANLLDSLSNTGSMGGGGHGSHSDVATHGYSLPLPNARTKNDLQDIDRFLEQLQATVYENSHAAAAAGIQQPGLHAIPGANLFGSNTQGGFRPDNSPLHFEHSMNSSGIHNSSMSNAAITPGIHSSASPGIDTPALTPASTTSYASSGHSPLSSHGRTSFGTASTSGNMYPSLPAVTGMSEYSTASSAPASGLASGFDFDSGRRYSGGRLQREAPAASEDIDMPEADDGSRTPKQSDVKPAVASIEAESESKDKANIDPALSGAEEKLRGSSPSTPAASAEDKRQEEWVENIRVIEALRKWVSERLRKGEFEGGEADVKPVVDEASNDVDMKTVETAKMVADQVAEKLAAVERANKEHDEEAKYPSLPLSS